MQNINGLNGATIPDLTSGLYYAAVVMIWCRGFTCYWVPMKLMQSALEWGEQTTPLTISDDWLTDKSTYRAHPSLGEEDDLVPSSGGWCGVSVVPGSLLYRSYCMIIESLILDTEENEQQCISSELGWDNIVGRDVAAQQKLGRWILNVI